MFIYGRTGRPLGRLGRVGRFSKSRGVIAGAVAASGFVIQSYAFGASATVTGVTTHNTVGVATTVPGTVSGYGASYSIYQPTDNYSVKYLNDDDAITSLSTGTLGSYNASGSGTVTVRRGASGSNNDTVWDAGTGTGTNGSTVTLNGSSVTNFNQALNANNVLMGADNVFSSMGNGVGNNTNVVRIDVLFTAGISASASTAFAIFDRGPSNDHDAFQIAAITSLSNGSPASYGSLQSFGDGTWGTSVIVPPGTTQENILRKDNTVPGDTFHPSDETSQSIGGELIQTDSLATTGTTIYGYSIFSAAATSALVNWTALPPADSTSTGGGLDPVATLGEVYTSESGVPEPASGMIGLLAAGAFITRRAKPKTSLQQI